MKFFLDGKKNICVTMNSRGFWANTACDTKLVSACITNNALYTTTTPPTTPPPPKCFSGWTDADGYCYKVIDFYNFTYYYC